MKSKKIIIALVCLQLVSLAVIIKLLFDKKDEDASHQLGRQYLEYAFIEDRYDIIILDHKNNDITKKFIEENKIYYKLGDWEQIMENFANESASISANDNYLNTNN